MRQLLGLAAAAAAAGGEEEEEEDKSAEKTASEVAAEGEGARCRGVPQSVGVRLASC